MGIISCNPQINLQGKHFCPHFIRAWGSGWSNHFLKDNIWVAFSLSFPIILHRLSWFGKWKILKNKFSIKSIRIILKCSNSFKNANPFSSSIYLPAHAKSMEVSGYSGGSLTASHYSGDCSHTCWECEVTNFKPCVNKIIPFCTPTLTFVFFYLYSQPSFFHAFTLSCYQIIHRSNTDRLCHSKRTGFSGF